ncbi:trypsin domain-containing protein [Ditylenchus destructor]|nr:trypsin domain-containing protein [Ditylenchus destructor]
MLIFILFCGLIPAYVISTYPCGLTPVKPHFLKNASDQYDARPYSWPWSATFCMVDDESLDCNTVGVGSIIGSKWILTSTYDSPKLTYLRVKTGVYNNTASGEIPGLAIHEVIRVINHPDAQSEENNLAVLELKDEIKYTEHVQPICLPLYDDPFQQKNFTAAWVTGWSVEQSTSSNMQHPELQQTFVRIVFPPRQPGMFMSFSSHQKEIIHGSALIRLSKSNKKWFQYGVVGSDYNPVMAAVSFARNVYSCKWISEATRGEVKCTPPNYDF